METPSGSTQSLSGASSAESYPPTINRKYVEIKKKKKFYSCQDLHSKYKRNRYQHVNSKVKEYIASMQDQDRRRKEMCKSVPETLNEFKYIKKSKKDDFTDKPKADEISKLRNEILESDYQTLQRNFEEKQQVISKIKRDLDTVKYELRKEKEKNSSLLKNQRLSNDDLRSIQIHKIMLSKGTQTDVVVSSLENLAIETDNDSDILFLANSLSDESNILSIEDLKLHKKNTKQLEKKRKFKKNFWSQFVGCFCSKKVQNECSYVQLPDDSK